MASRSSVFEFIEVGEGYISRKSTTVALTDDIKVFKDIMESGAVLEQGIAISKIGESLKKNIPFGLEVSNEPYSIDDDTAYYPIDENEVLDLFNNLKRLSKYREDRDFKNMSSEEIKEFLKYDLFSSINIKNRNKLIVLKKIALFFALFSGTLNAIEGNVLISIIVYLCGLFQLDYYSISSVVMSSSLSTEKKKLIMENIKNHNINPADITYDKRINLYARSSIETKLTLK